MKTPYKRFGIKRVTEAEYNRALHTKRLAENELKKIEAAGYNAINLDAWEKAKDAIGIASSKIRKYERQKAKRK